MTDLRVRLRAATPADLPFLWTMLAAAISADPPWTVEQAQATLDVAHYLDRWPLPGDGGVVAALDESIAHEGHRNDHPVGAAWYRQFPAGDRGYGWVAPDVPELSIAVVPEARGRGIGGALLGALLQKAATAGIERISLSVDPSNAVAIRLYNRFGFQPVDNADAGDSLTMVVPVSAGGEIGEELGG